MINCLRVIILSTLCVSCGNDSRFDRDEYSSLNEVNQDLFILLGGRNSCSDSPAPFGQDPYGPLRGLIGDVSTEQNIVKTIISCYGTDDRVKHVIDGDDSGKLTVDSMNDFHKRLGTFIEANEFNRIILIGYSYGGWLSMKTALIIDSPIHSFYTLDPISRATCPSAGGWRHLEILAIGGKN